MSRTNFEELLKAGVHFGHLKRKWNPKMAPYIFMERDRIHIIDLHKTVDKMEEACNALRQIAKSGRKILFVATKKQAKEQVSAALEGTQMPYVTERWLGGMLTNFPTIRRTIKKMTALERLTLDEAYQSLSKRERLHISRQREKLDRLFGSIADMNRLPAALFIVDVLREKNAVREAERLGITIFAMVDTNSDPSNIDFPIPANDDASDSIGLIIRHATDAIKEGLAAKKADLEKQQKEQAEEKKKKKEAEEAKNKQEGGENQE